MNDKTVLIEIDNLMDGCGYSYQDDAGINNYYNCNHLDQEDFEYTKDDKIVELRDCIKEFIISKIIGRKKRLRNKIIKKYFPGWENKEEYWSKKLNLKKVGRCYSRSCPLAYPADLQDMKELDQDLYNEYKESADDQGCISSDWVVLIKEPNDE